MRASIKSWVQVRRNSHRWRWDGNLIARSESARILHVGHRPTLASGRRDADGLDVEQGREAPATVGMNIGTPIGLATYGHYNYHVHDGCKPRSGRKRVLGGVTGGLT